jgi:Asp-tRNA(Asn)/Glu-tRNA(Gln) amidotransferase A subunit family amidase
MSFRFQTIADYAEAYRSGRATPVDVARRVLSATTQSDSLEPPLRAFISQSQRDVLAQAEASAARYAAGEPLSALDGVPVAIKDEVDQRGYSTSVGTRFLGHREAARDDAFAVSRLREAGAVLIGKANMQEIGLGVTGINPHHGAARNPYNPGHMTGGSSSGSGVAVAAGLCPLALGADGGGSIRIPAALCGVAGIKGTYGRVSEHGAAALCWSVAHIGPLAATVGDAALALELMAGEDPVDPNTLGQPPLSLAELVDAGPDAAKASISGLRIGWCERWAQRADADVRAANEAALARLEALGATRVPVEIVHLDHHAPVQYLTIGVEMAAAQYELRRAHQRDYCADTRLLLEMASQVPAVDYVRAQRLRTLIHDELVRLFEGDDAIDVLATPSAASAAPPIPDDALKSGLSDDAVLEAITAFSFAANLSGQPAMSLPVGYDAAGLPLGLQLMGKHWDEATLVRVGLAVEADVEPRRPEVFYQLLD